MLEEKGKNSFLRIREDIVETRNRWPVMTAVMRFVIAVDDCLFCVEPFRCAGRARRVTERLHRFDFGDRAHKQLGRQSSQSVSQSVNAARVYNSKVAVAAREGMMMLAQTSPVRRKEKRRISKGKQQSNIPTTHHTPPTIYEIRRRVSGGSSLSSQIKQSRPSATSRFSL